MDQRNPRSSVLEPPVQIDAIAPSAQQPQVGRSDAARWRNPKSTASAVGLFILHFVEMVIAMGLGMAIFGPVRGGLVDQGYTALLERTSLDYQVWMNAFMIVPMVLWMRLRGCTWGHGVGMAVAMVVPPACVLLLCRFGVTEVIPWFTTSLTGLAMFLGMLAFMLYHREMYTGRYSFGWARKT
jgi:hypothetical protein